MSAPPLPRFDEVRLLAHWKSLGNAAETQGGLEFFVAGLKAKQQLFVNVLADEALPQLDPENLALIVESVFPARRRLWCYLENLGWPRVRELIGELFAEGKPVEERITTFVAAFPSDKRARGARDLAAELLHFRQPERYPLMARWVWDAKVNTGALRELTAEGPRGEPMAVGDDLPVFQETFERLQRFLGEQGVLKDLTLTADLLIAHVYADYLRSLAEGYLKSDFGGKHDPMEHTKKLLGIDESRRQDKSRLVRDQVH
ncbi:MAG: hypothetical protein COX57_10825 [Alphaproteobacteria bacterium CG_4_10_14_0_2_um_filter_63_37]|nr:MAG: hypothetical protein AUJ55_10775 [Proteobacteria bacterium CG1_02_64_396]PJA24073.1 MAG: hypothetical protein COX57_10825 [Alphaproteobacteria bacterium CG_4_10_14_0_2_um_filter_63_37]